MKRYILCIRIYGTLLLMVGLPLHAYKIVNLTPGTVLPQGEPTYYTPNREQAVYLTQQEVAQLDFALRNSLDNEQEFNQRVDDSFIKKTKAACQQDNACELIEKVLGDFKGKRLRAMFSAIGLRTSI